MCRHLKPDKNESCIIARGEAKGPSRPIDLYPRATVVADLEGGMGPCPPWASKGPFRLRKEQLECPKELCVSFNKYFGALWKGSLISWETLWAHKGPSERLKKPSERPEGAFWAHSEPSERLKRSPEQPEGPLWAARRSPLSFQGALCQVAPPFGQILDPPLGSSFVRHSSI